MKLAQLLALIRDAEYRIGSYVAGGGSSDDHYVKSQIKKIELWDQQVKKLLTHESD